MSSCYRHYFVNIRRKTQAHVEDKGMPCCSYLNYEMREDGKDMFQLLLQISRGILFSNRLSRKLIQRW